MPVKSEFVSSDSATDSSHHRCCSYEELGCKFKPQNSLDLERHKNGIDEGVRHLQLVKNTSQSIDKKIYELKTEMNNLTNDVNNLKMVTKSDESLSELKKLVRTFPLCNLKNSQYLHATQLQVAELKEQIDKEKVLREKQSEEINELRDAIETMKASSSSAEQHHERNEPMDTDATDSGSRFSLHSRADSGYYSASTQSLNSSSILSSSTMTLSDPEVKSLSERMSAAEKKIEEVKKEQERWKQLERFVMHLHERIKSLDCGRTGKLIWKISGFSTIFENAKSVEARKQKNLKVDPNTPCDFCSPLFYTSPHGYLLYMRLYPYGCDSAVGKFMSLFVALSPGEYDGILPWPFRATLEISLLSQEEPNEKWTQNIVPGGNNIACFQRPSSKSGNLSVGILHFIVHSKLYGQSSSPYIQNDTIYIEVCVKELEHVSPVGPSKPKAARAANPGANTSTRASPEYRPNSGSTITLMSNQ